MKKYLLGILSLGLLVTTANAGCTAAGCANVDVTRVLASQNGNILIGTSGDENSLNCTAPGGGKFMTLKNDAVAKNTIYSALLSAFVAKKKVQINIIPGSAVCEIAFINLL